ncbi:uncharacterized protein PG986_002130 [Apiospora aurea]|uniref:Uncharacterized protein n=1 Tax=Apiospora aurea TaxID=335848 RepID=A0ABR1QYV7_9PEZI
MLAVGGPALLGLCASSICGVVVAVLILATSLLVKLAVVVTGTNRSGPVAKLITAIQTNLADPSHVFSVTVTRNLDSAVVATKVLSPTAKRIHIGCLLSIMATSGRPDMAILSIEVVVVVLGLHLLEVASLGPLAAQVVDDGLLVLDLLLVGLEQTIGLGALLLASLGSGSALSRRSSPSIARGHDEVGHLESLALDGSRLCGGAEAIDDHDCQLVGRILVGGFLGTIDGAFD